MKCHHFRPPTPFLAVPGFRKSLVMKRQEGTTKGLRGPKNHILEVVLITVCGGGVGRNGWPCAAG